MKTVYLKIDTRLFLVSNDNLSLMKEDYKLINTLFEGIGKRIEEMPTVEGIKITVKLTGNSNLE